MSFVLTDEHLNYLAKRYNEEKELYKKNGFEYYPKTFEKFVENYFEVKMKRRLALVGVLIG